MNIIGSLCFSGSCTKLCNYAKLYNPILKQVRYRKQHLNKPVSHLQREIVKAVSKPRYPKWYKGLPIEEICTKSLIAKNIAEEGKVIHPLDRIMGEEVREILLNAPFIAIFQGNPCTKEHFFNFKLDLHKINITYVFHNPTVITHALEGTHYQALLKLYEGKTLSFIGPEPNFTKILRIEKKYAFASLLGGVYQGRIISVTDFKNLSLNSNIQSYYSQLSGILSASSQRLSSGLTRHQQELCDSLRRYTSDTTEEKDTQE